MTFFKLATVIVAFGCVLMDPYGAAAQTVRYDLMASDSGSLDDADLAGLASRLLNSPPDGVTRPPADRAALLLAARASDNPAQAYRAIGCVPDADPMSSRTCFLTAWAQSQSGDVPLADRLGALLAPLDPVAKERLLGWLRVRERADGAMLDRLLGQYAGAEIIGDEDAMQIVETALVLRAYQRAGATIDALVAQERTRSYQIDEDIVIHTPQGATLSATLVLPRTAGEPLPTAMWFTIYSDLARNREIAAMAAAHGYAGLVVNARGKLQSTDEIRPYEVEVDDTVAAIEWASQQGWSDGRVGMYGGSYTGFAAWAATKRLPEALKTIVPYVAAVPGQGLPMENNVFLNANYGWAFYVANNRTLDRETYNDPDRWSSLNENWYRSGRPYKDIDAIDGTPNPWLQRWLQHPSYDEYWQAMVPYSDDFAHIDIPVLSITGYYDDGQISAVRYFKEHYRHRPDAEHFLLIGPYDHFGAQQSFKPTQIRGYAIDPVAQFDTSEITFAWFDHVFRGKPRPAILKDRVNFEVMGANVWRHAPSLTAMSKTTQRFFLTNAVSNGHYLLSERPPEEAGTISQSVDFADRTTSDAGYYPYPILNQDPDLASGTVFASEPLAQAVEVSGGFSGELHVRTNKRDFDFLVALYELRADGSTLPLSYYMGRASYARDITTRRLLEPGAVSVIPFERTRLVSREVQSGSRLLVVVDVIKNSFHEINYGTGGTVSEESIGDSSVPLTIDWLTDSFIEVPITRISETSIGQ